MDSYYDLFEIANVIHDFWLIDAESYQKKYRTTEGKPLTPGFYIVNWPETIQDRRFNEHAEFHGPFNSRKEAQASLEWMDKVYRNFLNRISANHLRCRTQLQDMVTQ